MTEPPGELASNAGYADEAPDLLVRYESGSFEDCWAGMLHLFPDPPATVLDLGAGSGRDAAALAARGHRVVAVEPTAAMRAGARRLHPDPTIRWLDDCLPRLDRVVVAPGFDLVMGMAVWMHLDPAERVAGMRRIGELLAPHGSLLLTLRHGPVPSGRRMFEVSGDETVALAASIGMSMTYRDETGSISASNRAAGVSWTRLSFRCGDPVAAT